MCVKLSLRNLNLSPYLSHSTNIYTCRVTTALKMCSGKNLIFLNGMYDTTKLKIGAELLGRSSKSMRNSSKFESYKQTKHKLPNSNKNLNEDWRS